MKFFNQISLKKESIKLITKLSSNFTSFKIIFKETGLDNEDFNENLKETSHLLSSNNNFHDKSFVFET